jgi:hypothetical protein
VEEVGESSPRRACQGRPQAAVQPRRARSLPNRTLERGGRRSRPPCQRPLLGRLTTIAGPARVLRRQKAARFRRPRDPTGRVSSKHWSEHPSLSHLPRKGASLGDLVAGSRTDRDRRRMACGESWVRSGSLSRPRRSRRTGLLRDLWSTYGSGAERRGTGDVPVSPSWSGRRQPARTNAGLTRAAVLGLQLLASGHPSEPGCWWPAGDPRGPPATAARSCGVTEGVDREAPQALRTPLERPDQCSGIRRRGGAARRGH